MVWIAAAFLFVIYCIIALLRRKFMITLTPNLWVVIMLSLFFGAVMLILPRVIAAQLDDARLSSALYITNAAGTGIIVCGSLLGCIAQAASEWGEARRAKKQTPKPQSD